MHKPLLEAAAICGLYCGTCPSYPQDCGGCLSTCASPECNDCRHGFRACVAAHGITRCNECREFPCQRLETFSRQHTVNGICHHAHVLDDLRRMNEIGVEGWLEEQRLAHTCPGCGRLIPWMNTSCPRCEDKAPAQRT